MKGLLNQRRNQYNGINNKLAKNNNLVKEKYEIIDDTIYIYVKSKDSLATCPYCNQSSNKIHSYYSRNFQDFPIQDKKVVIVLKNRKFFCKNPECSKKTFAERFQFISDNPKRTKRLEDEILNNSINISSVAASKILRRNIANKLESTICEIIKKSNSN